MRVEQFFADQHGGKSAKQSAADGETFTAIYIIEFVKRFEKTKRERKNADPSYQMFIDIWNKYFPNLLDFPRDGKHFKSLIKKCEKLLEVKGKEINTATVCNVFEYIVQYVKTQNVYPAGEPVSVFDSRFQSIVYKMQFGQKQVDFNSQNSSNRVFGKYSNV